MKAFSVRWSRDKLFYRYWISFLLLCAVPILLLSWQMYGSAAVSLQEEVEQANLGKLNLIKTMIDQRLKEMQQMAARIADDSSISPTNLATEGYARIDAVRQLSKYKANNSLVDEVFLAYRDHNYIYSSAGMYSFNSFEQYFYALPPEDAARLRKALDETDREQVLKFSVGLKDGSTGPEMLGFLYPILTSGNTSKGTVLFVVKESVLSAMLQETSTNLKGETLVLNEKGEQVAGFTTEAAAINDLQGMIRSFKKTGVYSAESSGTTYSIVLIRSDTSGWSYVEAGPSTQFFSRVFKLRNLLYLVLTVVVVIAAGSGFLLAAYNYRPIRRLAEHLQRDLPITAADAEGEAPDPRRQTGLEMIGHVAQYAIESSKRLQERVLQQREVMTEQLMQKLLGGKLSTPDELSYWLESVEQRFAFPAFYVAVITLRDPGGFNAHLKSEVLELLSQDTLDNYWMYCVEPAEEQWLAVIVNTNEEETAETVLRSRGSFLTEILHEHLGMAPIVAIGSPVADPLQINRSYVEASACLEQSIITGEEGYRLFAELKREANHEYWYPIDEQLRLVQSIRQGDRTVAMENLHLIMKALSSRGSSLLMLRYVCFDVVNSFIKAVKALDKDRYSRELEDLMAFQTLGELESKLTALIDAVCGMVERMKETRHDALIGRMIGLVNESFDNPSLNLDMVADGCGVSVSHIGKLFREHVGTTFGDYVTDLRMKEIKRRLIETEEAIKDIVQRCGYIDLPNFVRKFKSIEGITPGQYRKLYGKLPARPTGEA
ncbi:helix-turn-helix domain-containing protein [Paenibacillus sp. TAB 01]|uniref:helix-turn-helix domain-containing protein n=1 Tax=Paenibacillus sp. TAB 01 TaxID=3368988 RepID=UPI003751DB99